MTDLLFDWMLTDNDFKYNDVKVLFQSKFLGVHETKLYIYSRTSKIRTPDNRTDRSTEQHALARARALAKFDHVM